MLLDARPRSLLGSSYTVTHGNRLLAEIHQGWVHGRGTCEIDGRLFEFHREGRWRPTYLLECRSHYHARAKSGGLRHSRYHVEIGYDEFDLRRLGWWQRDFGLFRDNRLVGRIYPPYAFSSRARLELPDDIEPAVAVFLGWLVLINWHRDGWV
jgi:hypothetical protein